MCSQSLLINRFFTEKKKMFSLESATERAINQQGILLHTGKTSEKNASKTHLLGLDPLLYVHEDFFCHIETNQTRYYAHNNVSNFLCKTLAENFQEKKTSFVFEGGFCGLFAYDYKNHLTPHVFKTHKSSFPKVWLVAYGLIEVYCQKTDTCLVIKQRVKKNTYQQTHQKKIIKSFEHLKKRINTTQFQKKNYIKNTKKIIKAIKKGDCYQVNISRVKRLRILKRHFKTRA